MAHEGANLSLTKRLELRELGRTSALRFKRSLRAPLHRSLQAVDFWDPDDLDVGVSRNSGGIFGMDFNADGSSLVAACENRSILVFDPFTRQMVHRLPNAHRDCVNTVRFLDNRLFASCSDDNVASLWDLRNLKSSVRVFKGHQNWVKNVEFVRSEGLLVTSGFDGCVYTWDLNKYSESQPEFTRAFFSPGLMRMRLTPDCSKMLISSQWGYLVVIHDLNMATISTDLAHFKPNIYWLMMNSGNVLRPATTINFQTFADANRNRPEIIVDWPAGTEPENVTSLVPHPHNWAVISRNTNANEASEWTCVHDIQWPPLSANRTAFEAVSQPQAHSQAESLPDLFAQFPHEEGPSPSPNDADENSWESEEIWGTFESTSNSPAPFSPASSGRADSASPEAIRIHLGGIGVGSFSSGLVGAELAVAEERQAAQLPPSYNRLSHFIDEPNVGRGFVKELAISPDGCLISSPFAFGLRLLAFSSDCAELCDCPPPPSGPPRRLVEVATVIPHHNVVLCSKFAPSQSLLVSGCLSGKIAFIQPQL